MAVLAGFRLEPLDTRRHDRKTFACGVDALDQYLRTQATQDMRRKANAVFVLVTVDRPDRIAGYFTLAATALAPSDVPPAAQRHLPRYPLVSATLIGRLAVARELQGRRLGSMLLALALGKAYDNASVIGSSMVVVDAIDEDAAGFYAAHGFTRLLESLRLILPTRSIGTLLATQTSG